MNDAKRIELLSRSNKRLTEENNRLKRKLGTYELKQAEIEALKSELEGLRETWQKEINDLRTEHDEYKKSLDEMLLFKKALCGKSDKPWFKIFGKR